MGTYTLAQLRDGIAQLAKLADRVSGRAIVTVEDEPLSSPDATPSGPADAETRPIRTIHFDRTYDGAGFAFDGTCTLPKNLEFGARDPRSEATAVLEQHIVWPRGKVRIVVSPDARRADGVVTAKVQITLTEDGRVRDP